MRSPISRYGQAFGGSREVIGAVDVPNAPTAGTPATLDPVLVHAVLDVFSWADRKVERPQRRTIKDFPTASAYAGRRQS